MRKALSTHLMLCQLWRNCCRWWWFWLLFQCSESLRSSSFINHVMRTRCYVENSKWRRKKNVSISSGVAASLLKQCTRYRSIDIESVINATPSTRSFVYPPLNMCFLNFIGRILKWLKSITSKHLCVQKLNNTAIAFIRSYSNMLPK